MFVKKIIITTACIIAIWIFFITQHQHGAEITLKKAQETDQLIPVLVLGSGPAGLTASLFTSRAGIKTVVLSGNEPGGNLAEISTIENWPGREPLSGATLVQDLEKQATHFGVEILLDQATKVDITDWPYLVTTEKNGQLRAMAIIVATGGEHKRLPVPGVDTYWGKGVGICSICDAPLHKGKTVIVVGGSDSAAERALQLAAYAKKVIMVVREHTLQAAHTLQQYMKKIPSIEILYDTQLYSIQGDGTNITQVQLLDNKTEKISTIAAHGVFFSIGYEPRSAIVAHAINHDAQGYITLYDNSQKTNVPGIFAAGLVSDWKYGKAITSAAQGACAGMDAIVFLESIGFSSISAQNWPGTFWQSPTVASTDTQKIEFTDISSQEQLQKIIKTHPHVLIKFFHPLCGTCKLIEKPFEQFAVAHPDIIYGVVNISTNGTLAHSLAIDHVPTFVLYQDGTVQQKVPIATMKDLEKLMAQL